MTPPLVGEVSASSRPREHRLARSTLSGWLSPNFVTQCESSCYKVNVDDDDDEDEGGEGEAE